MGAGGGAAVGVITELVDVESTLGVGVVAGDVPGDAGRGALIGLLEGDSTGDLRVTAEDSNYSQSLVLGTFMLIKCTNPRVPTTFWKLGRARILEPGTLEQQSTAARTVVVECPRESCGEEERRR